MAHRAYALTLALLVALVAGAWAVPDRSPRDARDRPAQQGVPMARAAS